MKETLLTLIKKRDTTPAEISKQLDISVAQIYQWNKKGISQHNPHFYKLKEIIPEIQPKETTLTHDGEEDKRYLAGRRKKKLILTETEEESYKEPEFNSTLFPKIHINKKTT
jgi:hypothetical protein